MESIVGVVIGLNSLLLGFIAVILAFEIKIETRETRKLIEDNKQRELDYFLIGLLNRFMDLLNSIRTLQAAHDTYDANEIPTDVKLRFVKTTKKLFDISFNALWTIYESRTQLLNIEFIRQFVELQRRKGMMDEAHEEKIEHKKYRPVSHLCATIAMEIDDIAINIQKHSKFDTDDLKDQVKSRIDKIAKLTKQPEKNK